MKDKELRDKVAGIIEKQTNKYDNAYWACADLIIPIIRKELAEEIKEKLEGLQRGTWQFTAHYEKLWDKFWEGY